MKKQKQRQRLMAGIMTAGVIVSSMSVTSHADKIENQLTTDEIMAIPGLVSIKTEVGDSASNPGLILDSENKHVGKAYGYSMFGKHGAVNFIEWLVKEDSRYGKIFDIEKINNMAGTQEFDKLWVRASKMDEYNFALYQQMYIREEYIEPIINSIKEEKGIDIIGHRGLEEALQQIVVRYGMRGVDLFKNALGGYSSIEEIDFNEVVERMLDLEIEFIESRSSFSDKIKESLIKRAKEKSQYLKEIHDFSLEYEVTKEKERVLVDKSSDEENDNNKFKNSLFELISEIFKF